MFEALKKEMKKQGYSGNRLSMEARISQCDFSRAINGKIVMYPKWKERIAEVLGVDKETLFKDYTCDEIITCTKCKHVWFDGATSEQFNCGLLGLQGMTDFDFYCAYAEGKDEK